MTSSAALVDPVVTVLLALYQQPETTLPALAQRTGLSRAAVQQTLTELTARRCLLEQTPTTLSLTAIGLPCWNDLLGQLATLRGWTLARRSMVFQQVRSTNDICWAAINDPQAHGLTVLADMQTAGRGRRGARWEASAGQSLLISILLRDATVNPETLTLLLGLAVARALETRLPHSVQIKWPNDVLVDGRKIAGVMVEKRHPHIVLGLGVNIAQGAADFPPELRPHATSLYLQTQRFHDRFPLLVALLEQIESWCLHPPATTDWIADWKARCPMLGTTITLHQNQRPLTGQILDIDPLQGLVLRDAHGVTHFCPAQTSTLNPR